MTFDMLVDLGIFVNYNERVNYNQYPNRGFTDSNLYLE